MPPHPDVGSENFISVTYHDTYPAISKSDYWGRTVLITGASKGVGRATTLAFARAGAANLIIAARSSLDSLENEIRSTAASSGASDASDALPTVIKLYLDVTSERDVDAAAQVVKQHVSSIDILINNAGCLGDFKPITETNRSEWWKTWEVNVKGTYLIAQKFLPMVLQSPSKTIINVSSRGALRSRFGASAYGSSKGAILRFTEFLDLEYGNQGLLAFAIHPGSVATELALGMPKYAHAVLIDRAELAANTMAWLTKERTEWLAGRYVSANWDMQELVTKKDEIVEGDKLKVRIVL